MNFNRLKIFLYQSIARQLYFGILDLWINQQFLGNRITMIEIISIDTKYDVNIYHILIIQGLFLNKDIF